MTFNLLYACVLSAARKMARWILRLIAVLEIGSGFMGASLVLISQPWKLNMSVSAWVVSGIALAVFLLGIAAGLALLEARRLGSTMSALYQAIQIPVLSSFLVTYNFIGGVQLGIAWQRDHIVFLGAHGAQFILCLWETTNPPTAGLNLLALMLFLYLWRMAD